MYRPFDKIPNELLAELLVWTSHFLDDDGRFLFPLRAPQFVARRWRDVTNSTPMLWRILKVDSRITSVALQNYLEKSGGMSLTIEVLRVEHLPLLLPYASRWEAITLWMNYRSNMDDVLEEMRLKSTSLRHFSAILPYEDNGPYFSKIINLLDRGLQSLHLTHVFITWTPQTLPFHNLNELVVRASGNPDEELDIGGMLETLRAFPRLRRLCLFTLWLNPDDIKSGLNQNAPTRPVELFELEELVLADLYVNEFLFLASQIRCPNLISLGVGLFEGDQTYLDSEVEWSKFSPVYADLKRLDIWSFSDSPTTLTLALQNIPSASILGVRAGGPFSPSKEGIDFDAFGQCFIELKRILSSVQVLQTRNMEIKSLCTLVNDWLPGGVSVQIYWRDVEELSPSDESSLRELPNVTLWGKETGDLWFLEGMHERTTRIDERFDY
ncbi:hypothetical protein FRC02_005150 [Tulasnella sp. 418]|nr:hypothetical protein FRC02_005150 [Tulasnella sp. 418]